MWLEILLAMIENFKVLAAILSALCFLYFGVCFASEFDETVIKPWKLFLCIGIVSVSVALLPSVNDLWKVRIGLIKLNLASHENIQKGADVIERIGKKLECKYLGCENVKEDGDE